jgi:hypothetical protein
VHASYGDKVDEVVRLPPVQEMGPLMVEVLRKSYGGVMAKSSVEQVASRGNRDSAAAER